jgi:hypothetical protein
MQHDLEFFHASIFKNHGSDLKEMFYEALSER